MKRVKDWQNRLHAALAEAVSRPFEFGRFDCALWAMECVDVQTGADLASGFRGQYGTADEAKALCESRGWATLRDAAADLLGTSPIKSAAYLKRGDVVWVPPVPLFRESFGLGALGVCIGGEATFVATEGIRYWPMIRLRPLGAVGFAVGA